MVLQDGNKEAIGSLLLGSTPMTSETMDARREESIVQDFLLKLDQARAWVCSIIGKELDITSFTEELPKSVILAKVAQFFDQTLTQKVFCGTEKEYRHVDNIVMFLDWCKSIKLRKHFLFETIDLYESKNIPNVIYCLHGLAMFLNKRGFHKGIVVNKNVKFTEEEALLFSSELKNVCLPSYDNIDSKLDSEEEETNEEVYVLNSEVSQSINSNEMQDLCTYFAKTLLWRKSFKNMMSITGIDIPTIRRFLSPHILNDIPHQILIGQQNDILEKYKANNKKEVEMDSLVHTIRLLHENVQARRGVLCDPYPLANDFKSVKMVLFRLIHDFDLCFSIIDAGYDLPFRTMFPDTTMGDYLFSKFIKNNFKKDVNLLITIARTHFMSSKVFHTISDVFTTTLDFDLSPTNIKHLLYRQSDNEKGQKNVNKFDLLDEALDDELVRNEIIRRSQMIIDFVDTKFKYLLNTNLPYYVKIFAEHPMFFENFIEAAIISSGNHTIAEVFGYVFSHDPHMPSALYIDRIIKEQDGFTKTPSIEYSDFSPLRNFLYECRSGNKNYKTALTKSQSVSIDPNDYFMEAATSEDVLQVEISIEDINNLIIVLKHNTDFMTPELMSHVKAMGFVHANAGSNVTIGVYSDHEESKEPAPICIDGVVSFVDTDKKPTKYREIDMKASPNSRNQSIQSVGKFILKLDNQFSSELDRFDPRSPRILSYEIKRNILALILASKKGTLGLILNEVEKKGDIDDLEAAAGVACELKDIGKDVCYEEDNKAIDTDNNSMCLYKIRKTLINEIDLLIKSKFITGGYQQVLEIVAKDYVSTKCGSISKEIALNSETLDALFQKGMKLDMALKSLYKYTSDLTRVIFVNKSGIFFNREVEPYSKYGTYLLPLSSFKAQAYESLDYCHLMIKISSNEPMVFQLSVLFKKELISNAVTLRYDSLLKMQEENVLCVDLNKVCCVSVGATIDVINEAYLNY